MKHNLLNILVAVSAVLFLGACGQGFQATNDPAALSAGLDAADLDAQLQAVETESNLAVAEAEALLSQVIKKDGSVNLKIFTKSNGVSTQMLEKPFEKVFSKIVEAIGKVEDLFDKAEGKINDAKAKLDPANPLHQLALKQLEEAAAKIKALETRVDGQLTKLGAMIAGVVNKIDLFLAGLNPILQFLLMGEIAKVKQAVMQFQMDLAAVIAR